MTIIARFFIHNAKIDVQHDGEIAAHVTLKACQRADGDNVSWTKWTPTGELTMSVLNPSAATFFRDHVGRDCRISIELEDDERHYGGEHQSAAEVDRIASAPQS